MCDAARASRHRRSLSVVTTAIALFLFVAPAAIAVPPAPGIPDPVSPGVPGHGRAWELVTPADVVAGRPVGPFELTPIRTMSPSGDWLSYRTFGTLPGAPTGSWPIAESIAKRGPDGWVSTPIRTLDYGEALSFYNGPVAFSHDFEETLWTHELRPIGSGYGVERRGPDGTYTHVLDIEGSPIENKMVIASSDLKRIYFASSEHLVPADATRTEGLSIYEYDGTAVRELDVEGGSVFSSCGTIPLAVGPDSGRAFFFGKTPCGALQYRIYMSVNGHTTEISAPQCTTPGCAPGDGFVSWGRMTPSGSVVWMTSAERLTDEDTNSLQDLYRYDVASGKLTLVTARPPASTVDQQFYDVYPTDDGSRAYFTAFGQLIPGQGGVAAGNLYLSDSAGLHYVGTVAGGGGGVYGATPYAWTPSQDGRYAVFASGDQLAGTDHDESVDIYRYDSATDGLTQISLGSEGRGNGAYDAPLGDLTIAIKKGGYADPADAVVFETSEALLPQDRNDVRDVYDWTPAGGLGLVSSGTPGFPAEYLFANPSGDTILFRTGATLLPRDRDGGELDIYAARVGGGFPEPPLDPGCTGACAEAPKAPPAHRQLPGAVDAKPRLELGPVDPAARRQLLRRGHTTLLVEVPAAGKLSASGTAPVDGKKQTVAGGEAKAKDAGPVRLTLKLTPIARRALARGDALRVRLSLSLAKQTLRTGFVLGGKS